MSPLHPKIPSASIALAHASMAPRLRGPQWVAALAVAAACLGPAAAQTVAFDIGAGPMQAALVGFAAKTGLSLKFEAEAVRDKKSNGVKGNLSVPAALDLLLKDTGLQARRLSDGIYSIEPARPLPAAAPTGAALKAQLAPAQQVLPTVEVIGTAVSAKGYVTSRSATSTRTSTPLGLTPQTIDVVTRAMLDDQQSASVAEALRNVPGVTVSGNNGFNSQVYLRGMAAPVAINGTTDGASGVAGFGTGSNGLSMPTIAVQGIEVLKGADAIVAGSPGNAPNFGLVNVELKKPQTTPVHELSAEFGSFGHKQVGLDLAGALNENKSLAYRLVAEIHKDQSAPGGFQGGKGSYLAPSLMYTYSGGSLLAGADFKRETAAPPYWTYIDFDGSIASPRQPLNGYSDHARLATDSAYLDWKQVLPADWTLRAKLTGSRSTSWSNTHTLGTNDYTSFVLDSSSAKSQLRKNDIDLSLSHPFSLGETTHKIVLGGNFQRLGLAYGGTTDSNYASVGQPLTALSDYSGTLRSMGKLTDSSMFVQDQIRWGDFTALLAITRSSEWGQYGVFGKTLVRESATNPSLGALYQINDTVSVYANVRKSFSPQASELLFDQSVAPPQEGQSKELGAKLYFNDDRLTMNLAYFDNKVTNSLLSEPDGLHLGPGFSSKGIELSLTGELAPGLRSVVSYTNMLLHYDSPYWPAAGAYPRHAMRAFLSYDLPGEAARGWSVGGGVTARSGYVVSYQNIDYIMALLTDGTAPLLTRRMPGQAELEANVAYTTKAWSATLGMKNLAGRTLYGDWVRQMAVPVNSDRVLTLSAKFNF